MNYYEAVLADLKSRRAEIDTAIAAIRRLTGSFQSNGSDVAESGNNITKKRHAPSRRKGGRVSAAANTINGKKPCKDCGKVRLVSEFPKNHTFSDGHTNRCKECSRTVANARAAERRAGKSSPPPQAHGQAVDRPAHAESAARSWSNWRAADLPILSLAVLHSGALPVPSQESA